MPSHRPQRGGSVGMAIGRMISRTSPRRQNRKPFVAIQARTWEGSLWNWNGPGLIIGRAVQSTGDSAATMSRRLIRHGVPWITSWQPSQRVATLSLTIVRMWTPMISIVSSMVAGEPERGGTCRKPWGRSLFAGSVGQRPSDMDNVDGRQLRLSLEFEPAQLERA